MVTKYVPPPVLTGSGDTGRRLVAFLSARNTGSPLNCGREYTAAMADCQDKYSSGLAGLAEGGRTMIGDIKAASLIHDRRRQINPMHLPVAGWAAHLRLVCIEWYIFLKSLSASGAGKLIKGHDISPRIGCTSVNNDTGFASE